MPQRGADSRISYRKTDNVVKSKYLRRGVADLTSMIGSGAGSPRRYHSARRYIPRGNP